METLCMSLILSQTIKNNAAITSVLILRLSDVALKVLLWIEEHICLILCSSLLHVYLFYVS